ncbi:MAG: hypothetical protein ACI4IG_03735 [Eubacterium sp.]
MKKFFNPKASITVPLFIVSGTVMYFLFRYSLLEIWYAYIIYPIAFYCVIIAVKLIVTAIVKIKNSSFVKRLLSPNNTLAIGTVCNLLFSVFYYCVAIHNKSIWEASLGIYYSVLTLSRFVLIKSVSKEESYQRKSCYISGNVLLILSIAMCIIIAQVIKNHQYYHYEGYLIYVNAMYTFFCFSTSFVNFIKHSKNNALILSTSKAICLSRALMSMFALQTAMFLSFGGDFESEYIMNICTGIGVSIAVLVISLYVIIKSKKGNIKAI